MLTIKCRFCSKDTLKSLTEIAKGAKYCSHRCYRYDQSGRRKERVPDGYWECGKCRAIKPQSEFYTHGSKKGFAGWCKTCRCEDERKRRSDMSLVKRFHHRYENDMEFRAREVLRAVGKRCRRNGLAFDLDIPWLASRFAGTCELTGLAFNRSVESRKSNPFTPSIDRINPGAGYTKDNCRVVLFAVNVALHNWGLETALPIMEALVRSQSKESAA